MKRKLPPEAFEFYIGLGIGRSYSAVAAHFNVVKGTVTAHAKRDDWQGRLAAMEERIRQECEEQAQTEMKAVRERQLKAARVLHTKALEVLRDLPPERAIRAASALKTAWSHELLILGQPTVRNATVEDITRREVHELLTSSDEDDWDIPEG